MKALLRNRDLRAVVAAIVAIASYHTISALTGFGEWVDATPSAQAAIRIAAILLFTPLGLIVLIWPPRGEGELNPIFYRLCGALMLLLTLANATILFGDPFNIRPE